VDKISRAGAGLAVAAVPGAGRRPWG
jgi:hypothetical protein